MPRGLEVSLPEELQPAVLEPALVVDWLARWVQFRQLCRLTLWKYMMRNEYVHQRVSDGKIQITILILTDDDCHQGGG